MISFSSITDRPKANLDDVSEWYITNTIIKDPPKGITTRRIVKVGENNDLLEAEDDSTDRNDAITQFARGVNPMVAVEYNNNNTMRTGNGFGNREAFLPYRIMKDGAFRPPIIDIRDLTPLSRQPRNTTSINTSAEFIDFSKSIRPSEEAIRHKEVLNTLPVTSMCSNRGYNLKTGVDQPYDVMYYIEEKPQRIKQGVSKQGTSIDNIGKNIVDGVAVDSLFRNSINGVLEGSSGKTQITKNDRSWFQNNQKMKELSNLTVATNGKGNEKDNLNRAIREVALKTPSYSVTTPRTLFGYHNGKLEEFNSSQAMIDPRRQRKTYGFGNEGQGGGGGIKPLSVSKLNNLRSSNNEISIRTK